jgi:hypothetical protein
MRGGNASSTPIVSLLEVKSGQSSCDTVAVAAVILVVERHAEVVEERHAEVVEPDQAGVRDV